MRNYLIVLFVAAVLPMALAEPFIGLMLWLLFSYMNPHRLAYGFVYDFHWVLLIASVTLASMIVHNNKLYKITWDRVSILLLVFLALTGISTLVAVNQSYATEHWVMLLKIEVMAFSTLLLIGDKKRLNWMIWVIVASFGLWGAKSGIFTIVHGGHYHVVGPYKSFFRDNNKFALVMCMAIPLMRYLQLQARQQWLRLALLGLMVLTAVSVVGTYSRGGLITLVAVSLMLILKSRKRTSYMLLLALTIPLLLNFVPQAWLHRMDGLSTGAAQQSESFQGRIQSWEFATSVAINRPLTGGGFGVWASRDMWAQYGPEDAVPRAIHSIWFEVLGEQGPIGLMVFVLLIFFSWRNLSIARRLTKNKDDLLWLYDLSGFVQVSFLALVIGGSALPQAYVDFNYQLMAFTVIIRSLASRESAINRGAVVMRTAQP